MKRFWFLADTFGPRGTNPITPLSPPPPPDFDLPVSTHAGEVIAQIATYVAKLESIDASWATLTILRDTEDALADLLGELDPEDR